MKIYKYSLTVGENVISAPQGNVISVASQDNKLVCWIAFQDFKEHSDIEKQTYKIFVAVTGHSFKMKSSSRFLGTVLLDGDSFVVHCYEILD